MLLDHLIAGLGISAPPGTPLDARICDITEDSRSVLPHALFVARRGTKADGRAFAEAAARHGAAAILSDDPALRIDHSPAPALLFSPDVPAAAAHLAERFYGHPTDRLALVGITGTKGKTTSAWLLHQILNHAGLRCGLIGTVCIDDGVEVAPASLTTPPAIELSRTFARMLDAGCAAAVIEASSHALHQKRTAGLRFRLGIFTNLAHDHLDYHGTLDAYADAKAILFESLPSGSQGGAAIVNAADPRTPRMVRDTRADILGCLVEGPNLPPAQPAIPIAARASIRAIDPGGMDLDLSGPWLTSTEPLSIRLPLIGPHNAMNALQAALAATRLGLHPHEALEGLRHASSPPGRLEPVTRPDAPFAVYVDYAHTEGSLRQVLAVARGLRPRSVHVIMGCGGDRDRAKRPLMGAAAAELADAVWVTSDNPRTEDPQSIIDQIVAGVPPAARARLRVEPDRARAITAAVAALQPGDILLIAGKGHENYQILPDGAAGGGAGGGGGTVKRHFDDREAARDALAARGMTHAIARQTAAHAASAHPVTTKTHHAVRPARGPAQ